MGGSLAANRELHASFAFRVAIARDEEVFFQDCGPIDSTISVGSFKEAGATIRIKWPDELEFGDVTLSRGASRSRLMHDWFQEVAASVIGPGGGAPISRRFMKNVDVYQLDRTRKTAKRYTLFDAFPISYQAGKWDNNSDSVVIESLTLAYHYYKLEIR